MPWWFLMGVVLAVFVMVLAVLGFLFPPSVDAEELFSPAQYSRLPYRRDELQYYAPELRQLKIHYLQALGAIGTKHHLSTSLTEITTTDNPGEYFLLVTSRPDHQPSFRWSGKFTIKHGYHARLTSCHVKIASPHWIIPITHEEQVAEVITSETERLLREWTEAALAVLNRR